MPPAPSIRQPTKRKFAIEPPALELAPTDPNGTGPDLLLESPPPSYRLKDPNPIRMSDIGTHGKVDAGNATKKRRVEPQSDKQADLIDVARHNKASSSSSKVVSLRPRPAATEGRKSRRLVVTNPDPDVSADANEASLSPPRNSADSSSKRALRRSTLDKKFPSPILSAQDDKDLISANATSSAIPASIPKSVFIVPNEASAKPLQLEKEHAWLATAYNLLLAFVAAPANLKMLHHVASMHFPHIGTDFAKQVLEANPHVVKVNLTSSGTPHPVTRDARHLAPFFFLHRRAFKVKVSDDNIPKELALELRNIMREMIPGPRFQINGPDDLPDQVALQFRGTLRDMIAPPQN